MGQESKPVAMDRTNKESDAFAMELIMSRTTWQSKLPQVEFRNGIVRKHQDSYRASIELLKTRVARDNLTPATPFRIPSIHAFDIKAGWIDFECIPNVCTLQHALSVSADAKAIGLVERAARGLAMIHQIPPVTGYPASPTPNVLGEWGVEQAFVHSDFSVKNILYETAADELYVIDWSPPPWLEGPLVNGARELDLGVFLLSMFLRRPFEPDRIPNPRRLMKAFVEAYCQTAAYSLDLDGFQTYFTRLSSRFVRASRDLRGTLPIMARYPSVLSARIAAAHLC